MGISGIARFLTPFVKGLNDNPLLPKYIFVIIDKDMAVALKCHGNNTSFVMGAALHYLVRQFDQLIDRRIHDLQEKWKGALMDEAYPQVIWVRMLKRPHTNTLYTYMLRNKFNTILEERILDGKPGRHRIISIDVELNEFDGFGNLTGPGEMRFWKEINRGLRKFDLGEITLLPRQSKAQNKVTTITRNDTKPDYHRSSRHRSGNRNDSHRSKHSNKHTSPHYHH